LQQDLRSWAVQIIQHGTVNGKTEKLTYNKDTKEFVFAENEYQFQLAKNALISKTKLIDQLIYL